MSVLQDVEIHIFKRILKCSLKTEAFNHGPFKLHEDWISFHHFWLKSGFGSLTKCVILQCDSSNEWNNNKKILN